MTTFNLSDHELHARASAYAVQHRVSYSDALDAVVSFAELSQPPATPTPSAHQTAQMTDAELDAAASRYAAQHGVDYITALKIVTTGTVVAADVPRASFASADDQRLHASALAYQQANGVSYSEALSCVTVEDRPAQFSEGSLSAAQIIESQPIEIFRAGTHVDNAGNSQVFSVADVQAMASAYNPLRHEAPMVLGHPEHDLPAQGWVKGLTATGDGRLLMQAAKVDPEFAQSVQSGRYKKRSASFYPPSAHGNPAPGQWYLRHVGWLGAQAPAVKGLGDVKFGSLEDDGAVSFS